MKKLILFLGLMFLSFGQILAGETDQQRVVYHGSDQNQTVNLNTEETRVEYRWVQVPYTERVCHMETRYRQECRTIPGQRVCRTIPGQRVCRTVPGRRVCRRNPRGGQVCRQEPPRQVCRQQPPRQQCRQLPPQRQCRQVPYQTQVCRNVTRYRQERRAYTVVDARTNAQVTYNFTPMVYRSAGVNVELNAELNRSHLSVSAQDYSNPSLLVKDEVTYQDRQGPRTAHYINEVHQITLLEADRLLSPIRSAIHVRDVVGEVLQLELGRVFYQSEIKFKLQVGHLGNVIFHQELLPHQFQVAHEEGTSVVSIPLTQLIGNLPMGTQLNFDFQIYVDVNKYINRPLNIKWQKSHQFTRILR